MNKGRRIRRALAVQDTPHGGNYEQKLASILATLALPAGQVVHTHIQHGTQCRIWTNGLCTCDPDIRIVTEDGTMLYPPKEMK